VEVNKERKLEEDRNFKERSFQVWFIVFFRSRAIEELVDEQTTKAVGDGCVDGGNVVSLT
jgi:hypothetical protein